MNGNSNKSSEATFLEDRQWKIVDGKLCSVKEFTPFMGCKVINGVAIKPKAVTNSKLPIPYATILLECTKLLKNIEVTGFITHKEDFINLWSAFMERGIKEDEEVLMYWSTRHYTKFFANLFSVSMPKILVMVSPKGIYKSCPKGLDWPPKENPEVLVHALESRSWWIPWVLSKKGKKIVHIR